MTNATAAADAGLDVLTRERLLRRIGLSTVPAANEEGLRLVHRAFVSHVPYEDLAVQLGEYRPLDLDGLVRRMLHGGRGGYCFEANTVLRALLEALGFAVERREGIVDSRDARSRGELTNHMALVAHTPGGGPFIAEAGLGEGPLDPLPLTEGTVTSGAFEYTIVRDDGGWWVEQHPSVSLPGFWFSGAVATLSAFEPHHRRLSNSPESSFVKTLVVQRPFDDHIRTLRARTLFYDGPAIRERHVLEDSSAFAHALQVNFGIDPRALGAERLARLWRQAEDQHARRDS
ncbi:MAG: arylamine N-acetyltransferase family protein [Solirubrobacteraceae bacterium]